MPNKIKNVLILGSSPDAARVRDWDLKQFDAIVAINNAWQLTDQWHYHIHPEDFPEERRPPSLDPSQTVITYKDYVPAQNALGGFVYAGGTMAFTAAYWALHALRPQTMAFVGCDMVYPAQQNTHFYGTGTADPLRDDITLQSLEAKSTRLLVLAFEQNCACVNLSSLDKSRLVFPRAAHINLSDSVNLLGTIKSYIHQQAVIKAKEREQALAYFAETGEYWKQLEDFDAAELGKLDQLWLQALK